MQKNYYEILRQVKQQTAYWFPYVVPYYQVQITDFLKNKPEQEFARRDV